MNIIIYGHNGWIGQQVINELNKENNKTTFYCSQYRVDDMVNIEKELLEQNPSHMLCLVGRTHGTIDDKEYTTIDYLEQPDKIYENVLTNNKMVTAEFKNTSSNSHIMHFMPCTKFIGCVKECKKMKEFINHLEILYGSNYSNDINIQDLINKWLLMKSQNDEIDLIDGQYIGTKNISNKLVNLEDIMSSTFLELNNKCYGLYVPSDELLKRNNYNWFCKLNSREVLEASTNLSKYLLLTN
jgi:hypothetical protein